MTRKQQRRAAKKARRRPDLHPGAILVRCGHCGTVQENRHQVVYLRPTEPCGACGHLYGTYAEPLASDRITR